MIVSLMGWETHLGTIPSEEASLPSGFSGIKKTLHINPRNELCHSWSVVSNLPGHPHTFFLSQLGAAFLNITKPCRIQCGSTNGSQDFVRSKMAVPKSCDGGTLGTGRRCIHSFSGTPECAAIY